MSTVSTGPPRFPCAAMTLDTQPARCRPPSRHRARRGILHRIYEIRRSLLSQFARNYCLARRLTVAITHRSRPEGFDGETQPLEKIAERGAERPLVSVLGFEHDAEPVRPGGTDEAFRSAL